MKGFDTKWRDVPHFIIGITKEIWEDREIGSLRHRYAPGVTRNTEQVFGLTVPAATPVTLNPREHLAYQWLPWPQAAERCFSSSNAEAIRQLPQHLPKGPLW